jgi:hypothetical protein
MTPRRTARLRIPDDKGAGLRSRALVCLATEATTNPWLIHSPTNCCIQDTDVARESDHNLSR